MTRLHQLGECLGATALGLALTLAAGCGGDVPVGGITNPNAGSMVDHDKAATRTDMNVTDQNAGNKEPIAESASSSPSSTGTSAGTGGPGGGQPGKDKAADVRQAAPEAATPAPTPAATPNAKENAGAASGGTRPSGPIKDGTPRSPQ